MSVNAVDKTPGNTTPLAGNVNDKVGNLASLTTSAKSTAVAAINELKRGLTNVATAEITADEGVTIIRQNLLKSVNTVTLICVLQKVMTLDTANLLCILPSGYRPPNSFEFVAINSTKGLPIVAEVSSTSGGLYVRPTSASADAAAQNITIFLTYVV